MKLTISPTASVSVIEGGVPVRLWEGETESGTRVQAFVALIAARKGQNLAELDRALTALPEPQEASALAPACPVAVGTVVAASDPAAAEVRGLCHAFDQVATQLAAHGSVGAVLDALASVYLDWLVRRHGAERAAALVTGLKTAVPAVAAAQREAALREVPAAGRA